MKNKKYFYYKYTFFKESLFLTALHLSKINIPCAKAKCGIPIKKINDNKQTQERFWYEP